MRADNGETVDLQIVAHVLGMKDHRYGRIRRLFVDLITKHEHFANDDLIGFVHRDDGVAVTDNSNASGHRVRFSLSRKLLIHIVDLER